MSELFRYTDKTFEIDPTQDLTREQVYQGLDERRDILKRRECVPRVFRDLGIDLLLDQLGGEDGQG